MDPFEKVTISQQEYCFLLSATWAAKYSRFGKTVHPAPWEGVLYGQNDGIYVLSNCEDIGSDDLIQFLFVGVPVDREWLKKAVAWYDIEHEIVLPLQRGRLSEEDYQKEVGRVTSVLMRRWPSDRLEEA